MSDPRVYVCGERGCGRRGDRRALLAELDGRAEVVPVGCQSVCEGPVAGVVVTGRLQWFERVATPKSRAALVEVLQGRRGKPRKPLAKRRVGKRAGKLRL